MISNSTTFPESKTDASNVAEKVSEVASQVKEKVSDMGRTAADKIDDNRGAAADGLQSAASALHGNAEKVTSLAHSTADKLSSTADYIRAHDVKGMMGDVEHLVKNNPGPSLLAAVVIGFLAGRAFTSNN
jgi:ElaB/YqjD/DUF883 family membrane-anchored ribosome-binding protein